MCTYIKVGPCSKCFDYRVVLSHNSETTVSTWVEFFSAEKLDQRAHVPEEFHVAIRRKGFGALKRILKVVQEDSTNKRLETNCRFPHCPGALHWITYDVTVCLTICNILTHFICLTPRSPKSHIMCVHSEVSVGDSRCSMWRGAGRAQADTGRLGAFLFKLLHPESNKWVQGGGERGEWGREKQEGRPQRERQVNTETYSGRESEKQIVGGLS